MFVAGVLLFVEVICLHNLQSSTPDEELESESELEELESESESDPSEPESDDPSGRM